MTGPSGRPLRAGTSVVDIVGGMFGAFGTVLALKQRESGPRRHQAGAVSVP
jgi:formyl-CoA transferase